MKLKARMRLRTDVQLDSTYCLLLTWDDDDDDDVAPNLQGCKQTNSVTDNNQLPNGS